HAGPRTRPIVQYSPQEGKSDIGVRISTPFWFATLAEFDNFAVDFPPEFVFHDRLLSCDKGKELSWERTLVFNKTYDPGCNFLSKTGFIHLAVSGSWWQVFRGFRNGVFFGHNTKPLSLLRRFLWRFDLAG